MGAPKYVRFAVDFEEWFPQGLYLVGEIQAVTEYQSQEDRARNRAVRPRVDEVTGCPLFASRITRCAVWHRSCCVCFPTGQAEC